MSTSPSSPSPGQGGAPTSSSLAAPPPGAEPDRPFPPVVYVPTAPGPDGTSRVAMQVLADGRTVLFVYSAMDRLADLYGDVGWGLMFENGPDVGAAFDSGVDAVTDTAGAIKDVGGAVIDGIGGLFG